ncbi:hypothetical protein GPA10_15040 [Streptomyces sp. p1417]|uniref:Uncharacterized protein n=1 Tax=Streptomyces typhae TaxID=2681492 RepID=A0A6L6WWU8_9ACTN|nr:hypothetical protein [Streptomyces typhae]
MKGVRFWQWVWTPGGRGSRNHAYLRERLVVLPLLTALAFTPFAWAYSSVRGGAAYVQERVAPALGNLAEARVSLQIADQEASDSLRAGRAVELSGLSERYRILSTRATQRLNQVARGGALSMAERQDLDVVAGLVADYGTWTAWAQANADDPALRKAALAYARSILCSAREKPSTSSGPDEHLGCRHNTGSDATAVVDRVTALERALQKRLASRVAVGADVLAAFLVSGVAFLLLVRGYWRTQVFLHRRFRLHASLPLLGAAVPLLALPLLAVDAVLVQRAQSDATATARALSGRTTPADKSTAEIADLEDSVDRELAEGRLAYLDGVSVWVLPAGLLSAAVTGGTLHAYRREYVRLTPAGATP